MTAKKQETSDNTFIPILRKALENFSSATALGGMSMLATPYFLGQYLHIDPDPRSAESRGRALQALIIDSANDLWSGTLPTTPDELMEAVNEERQEKGNKGPRYHFLLLELCFIRQYFSPRTAPNAPTEIIDFIAVSKTRFYEHLGRAVELLGDLVLTRVRPTFRLEQPQLSVSLVGRDDLQGKILANLLDRRSTSLSGLGGSGKTALGTAVVQQWPTGCAFWFTFHPGLNDDLDSLLFSLGHFLNQWGRSSLWLQLLANQGKAVSPAEAVNFLLNDLRTNGLLWPLLCFDEVDLLQTSGEQPRRIVHIQVLEFLESLRGHVPLLLIGQRALIDTDAPYILQPLSEEESRQLLKNLDVHLDSVQRQRIYRYTEGNPRLLELYAAILKSGDKVIDVLQMPKSLAAQPLFSRLWKRLDENERQILGDLSVFRSVAPQDVWNAEHLALNGLLKRNLVKADGQGGVTILPFFRQLVASILPAELLKESHYKAATVRARYAEYTSAAHHFYQAGDYATCIQTWYHYKEQETQRGHARAAYELFRNFPTGSLKEDVQKQLKIVQCHLHRLVGESELILRDLENFSWHPEKEISADARSYLARAYGNLGDLEVGLQHYDSAIDTLGRLSNKVIELNSMRGQLFIRSADLPSARHEIERAHYQTELLQAMVENAAGNVRNASSHFQNALRRAQTINDDDKVASAHLGLLLVASRQGQVEVAAQHAQAAMEHFEKTGNRIYLEGTRSELAGVYVNARRFADAIAPAEQALAFFERIKHERRIPAICNNLAEAYFETGQIEKAKEYAFRVLDFENPRSHPYAHYTLGLVHEQEGSFENAEAVFSRGIEIAQGNEDKYIEAYLHRVLGNVYIRQDKIADGEESLAMANRLFQDMGLTHEVTTP